MKTLIIISIICSIILFISKCIKARKYYKQYDDSLFEYNKGRGYMNTYLEHKEKYLHNTMLAIVFLIAIIMLSMALLEQITITE